MAVTGAQIRAARGLLNMSVAQLASRTGLAINTIRKAEGTNDVAPVTAATLKLLEATFDACGICFIPADELGPGVRFRNPETKPVGRRRRG